jgi:hypothetical protein
MQVAVPGNEGTWRAGRAEASERKGASRRMILDTLFALIYVAVAAIYGISLGQLKRFLAETRAIGDTSSLERYKELVRRQMHLALAAIVVLLAGLGLGIFLIRSHGVSGLLVVLLLNAAVLGMGLYHKRLESRARDLPTSSPELEQTYRHISTTWLKKALPDF